MNRSAFDVFFCFLSIFLTFDSKLYFLILYTNSSACLLHLNITQIFAIRVRTHNSWCPNAERVSSSWSWWKETPYCARSRISNLTVLPWALSNMFEEIGLQVALVLKESFIWKVWKYQFKKTPKKEKKNTNSRNPGRKQDHRVKNQLLHRKTGKKTQKKDKKKVKKGDFPKKVCLHHIFSRFLKQWIPFYLPVFHVFLK